MKSVLVLVSVLVVLSSADPRRRKSKFAPEPSNFTGAVQQESQRQGKLFSLFNVVQFKNDGCASSGTLTGGGNRNGTCYSSSECADRNGAAMGSCAAGFGVCCVFQLSAAMTNTVTENCTYIQNPGFPAASTEAATIVYNVNKCSSEVCFIRLDFEVFDIVGITGTNADMEGPCQDTFIATSNPADTTPTICGLNTGQHIYVDIGTEPMDMATLTFTLAGAGNRMWDIKVTQVECGSPTAPPSGCLQYFVGFTGRFETFNFDAMGQSHLPNQQYSACIRPEAGFCCVQYQVCPDITDGTGFTLDTSAGTPGMAGPPIVPGVPAGASVLDDGCAALDFVGISGSGAVCNPGGNALLINRFCGDVFAPVAGQAVNAAVCDCTLPFAVDIHTDDGNGAALQVQSRGVCLEWSQIPC